MSKLGGQLVGLVAITFLLSWIIFIQIEHNVANSNQIWHPNHFDVSQDVTIKYDYEKLLFIHVPKTGGTAFSAILRAIQCFRYPTNFKDCCQNPGSCYFKEHRRCASILGCVSHQPRSDLIDEVKYSIVLFREPVARIVSGWFYAGHNPNNDAFHVRPAFLDIRKGRLPRVGYEEYIRMDEYRNIQTRMIGANSFPYRPVEVNETVLRNAMSAVDRLFFVGLQEEWAVSALLLARLMNASTTSLEQQILSAPQERSTRSTSICAVSHSDECQRTHESAAGTVNDYSPESKRSLVENQTLIRLTESLNTYDVVLYRHAEQRFCQDAAAYPDLVARMHNTGRCTKS